MNPLLDITGVILAGGESRRFGSNKALALLRGKPLIQHVADRVTSIFNDCLLVTNSPQQYDFLNMETIFDRYRDMGPLAGIHAALQHTGNSWIFVIGCDMPAVTTDAINFLCSLAEDSYDAVIPWLKTGAEPLCGLYHKTVFDRIELQLKNNEAQVKELLGNIVVRKVKEKELQTVAVDTRAFVNINREQDLESLS
jgi:molybdopterin-guanine dinucleotide biosynthesis protein A